MALWFGVHWRRDPGEFGVVVLPCHAEGCPRAILEGAKQLPVEQPQVFELAKALGLTIPRSLWLRADQVLE